MSNLLRYRVGLAGLLAFGLTKPALSQDEPQKPQTESPSSTAESPDVKGYQQQESDDVALPLKPLVPRSAAITARNEALSWYMTGRLLDSTHRNEPRKALNAFRKAVKLDPEAVEIYRELVPLELQHENLEAAVRYASKAVQLDPDDVEILQLLARQAAISGQLPEAIKHLEQAIKSPRILKTSPEYVGLNKSLGLLYAVTGQKESAADCYEILFDAIKDPEKYGLDSRAKKSLLADPTSTYERIGQILLDGDRLKPALEAFELAGTTRQGAGNLAYNRARVLLLSDKPEEALAELQKYFDAQRTSKGRDAYRLLAEILEKLNKSDELIGRLETLAENDAQNVALQYYLAERLTDVNELERARKIYDTMLQSGGDASGYAGLARVLRKMQKSDDLLDALGRGMARGEEAIASLESEVKALAEDKALVAMLIESGRTRAKAGELKLDEAILLAKLAAALKEADASEEFFQLALSLPPSPNRPKIATQIEFADTMARLRKYRVAAEAYHEILESGQLTEKGRAWTYFSLTQVLTRDNQIDKALEAITKAIQLDDDNYEFRLFESGIYTHARRWDEALLKLEQVMTDFPDVPEVVTRAQFSLSNVYVQKGEMRKGEEILEKVLEMDPESSQANNDLGYLWAEQGKNLERAEKMIRKALQAEPENPAYLDSLGWVLFKLDRIEEAIPPLEQATQNSFGGDATLWDHLGDVLLKAMQTEKAIEAWQTALEHSEEENSPDVELMERIREKLKQHGAQSRPKPAEKGSP
ncbi:tetratricopeptide repeat protein [Schlesneria sp. DSM 10557]|uniref:tetratricopeptide repeat protein n=2 Tax=unclassified Schlesneria TaxID=2762017 RepID=UPI00359FB726